MIIHFLNTEILYPLSNFSFPPISWKLGNNRWYHYNLSWYIIQSDFPSHWNNCPVSLEGISKSLDLALAQPSSAEYGFNK